MQVDVMTASIDNEPNGAPAGKGESGTDSKRFGSFTLRPASKRVAAEGGEVVKTAGKTPAADVPSDPNAIPDDLVEIGVIAQAYGVRGQVKIFPHATVGQGGDALLAAPYWWVNGGRPKVMRRVQIRDARPHSGAIAAALDGSNDRNDAEALRGSTVSVRRADFPKLSGGEYYWVDLIGLDVVSPTGTALGRVSDLMDNGAHSVLRVAYPTTDAKGQAVDGERLIPFVDAYLREVDLAGKRIVVDWDVDY
jgi:16S rRNA processing protein RimM